MKERIRDKAHHKGHTRRQITAQVQVVIRPMMTAVPKITQFSLNVLIECVNINYNKEVCEKPHGFLAYV